MIHKFIDISCRITKEEARWLLKSVDIQLNKSKRERRLQRKWKATGPHPVPEIRDTFGFEKRVDCVQYTRYDTGRPVFGKEGVQNASIANLFADLVRANYVFVDAKVTKKEGKYGTTAYNLRLHFEPSATDPIHLSPTCRIEIDRILAQSWEHAHVWENPDASCTVNVGKTFLPNETQIVHAIHMNDQGQFSTDPSL